MNEPREFDYLRSVEALARAERQWLEEPEEREYFEEDGDREYDRRKDEGLL